MAVWLNPGSPEAIEQGCVCPEEANNYGAGHQGRVGRTYVLNPDCPVCVDDETRAAFNDPPDSWVPFSQVIAEAEAEARRKGEA